MIRGLSARLAVRRELQRPLEKSASDGTLSRQLLRSLEADGEFYVDHGGPWIKLPLGDGEWRATNFDTGRPAARGEYAMADETYDELLGRLADHAIATVSEPLRANLVAYYGNIDSLPAGTDVERKRSATIRQQLALLGTMQKP